MEFAFALPLLALPLLLPFVAGQMAKSFGRKFWPWFFAGLVLPFVAHIILLCLPDKKKKQTNAVEKTDLVDHHFKTIKS